MIEKSFSDLDSDLRHDQHYTRVMIKQYLDALPFYERHLNILDAKCRFFSGNGYIL